MALEKSLNREQFGRIGVLMGGSSSEREISLKSGRAVYESLKSSGLDVVGLDIRDTDVDKIKTQIKKKAIKIAFIALHGGFGEDGSIQKLLEEINIFYTGSGVEASRCALNKIESRNRLKKFGINVPDAVVINKPLKSLQQFGKFPLAIKPASSGSSIGLTIVNTREDLLIALEEAFSYDKYILVEDFIKGRELTVGILEEKPLAVIEIIPKRDFFDYQAKYTDGLTEYIVPAKLTQKLKNHIQELGLAAHVALGCFGFSRVDMILDEDNIPFVLEANTIPGMTLTSLIPKAAAAGGISFDQLCIKLLKLASNPTRIGLTYSSKRKGQTLKGR